MGGATYRARLERDGEVDERRGVFCDDDGRAHRLVATTGPEGTFLIWRATHLTLDAGRVAVYTFVRTTRERGSAYLI